MDGREGERISELKWGRDEMLRCFCDDEFQSGHASTEVEILAPTVLYNLSSVLQIILKD